MNNPQTSHDLLLTTPNLDWRLWANPNSVLDDAAMSKDDKRALLASWASDARAIPNYPALRQLESGHLVAIDNVLNALKRLDNRPSLPPAKDVGIDRNNLARKGHWSRLARLWRRDDDDDDDGPTSPAPAGVSPRPPVLDSAAA